MIEDEDTEPLVLCSTSGVPIIPPSSDAPTDVRDMWIFSSAQCVSAIGSWAQKACIGWLAWDLTHSPAWVGGLALTDLVAALWIAPLAGTVTDRGNPLRLLNITNWAMMASAGLLCLLSIGGEISIYVLWVLALFDSTTQGFGQPVRTSAVSLIVPPNRLSQAISLNSIGFNLARSIGPALAGVTIAEWNVSIVFAFNMASYLAIKVALVLLADRLDRPILRPHAAFSQDMIEGFRHVASTPAILVIFLLSAAVSLLARPFTELLPALSGVLFHGGPQTLTLFMTAQGIGALVGATWMLSRSGTGHLLTTTFASAFALAVSLLVFSITKELWPAVGVIAVAGLFHVVNNIGMQSLLQLRTANRVKGRVLNFYGLMFRTGPSVGAFAIGIAAEWIPLSDAIGVSAAVAALMILLLSRCRKHAAIEAIAAATA